MKIVVVGAGNGGCFTALTYAQVLKDVSPPYEIELIYDPDISPEIDGQATFQSVPAILYQTLEFDWYNNHIHATPKSGILYEGWGKVNHKWFHPFPAHNMAMHFCPSEMQHYILNSGYFKVSQSKVLNPQDIDADYVFDCRGKPTDFTDYDELINPTNACILAEPNWDTTEALWSRHVATPDGWTFVIPMKEDSPSRSGTVGYCYNSNITSREDAEKNMLEMFDVKITKHIQYKSYIAKNLVVDDRIFLNGNRLFFIEPLESSALQTHLEWARFAYDFIIGRNIEIKEATKQMKSYIERVQNFILWHYQFGSRYETPFWDYAKTLSFKDADFNIRLKQIRKLDRGDVVAPEYGGEVFPNSNYGCWDLSSFKLWEDGMTRHFT